VRVLWTMAQSASRWLANVYSATQRRLRGVALPCSSAGTGAEAQSCRLLAGAAASIPLRACKPRQPPAPPIDLADHTDKTDASAERMQRLAARLMKVGRLARAALGDLEDLHRDTKAAGIVDLL